ncbi:MAG: hypothetical protein H6867_04535 [Rhodospirillales bacterium]|nr:hypothetical protein [Rhodospirillales bacterium]MCB9996418.1 hypothetical protein [Rhodospirillales bacterium]
MKEWLTKKGILAVCFDVAAQPVNVAAAFYKAGCCNRKSGFGVMMAMYSQTPSLLVGIPAALLFNPVAGMAAYIAASHVTAAIGRGGCNMPAREFWPNCNDYSESLKTAKPPEPGR